MEQETIDVKITKLKPNPYQPESRLKVDEETRRRFGESIYENGLLQIPIARLNSAGEFELGDGWLRRAGFEWLVENGHSEYDTMPVTLRAFDDQQMADLVMEANTIRKDLNPIELAQFYNKYLISFPQVTQAQFAERHHRTQGEISNTLRLLDLPEYVRQKIISREISETHGRALLRLPKSDTALITGFCNDSITEGWSVSQLNEHIGAYLDAQKPKMEIDPAGDDETEIPDMTPEERQGVAEAIEQRTPDMVGSEPVEPLDEKAEEIPGLDETVQEQAENSSTKNDAETEPGEEATEEEPEDTGKELNNAKHGTKTAAGESIAPVNESKAPAADTKPEPEPACAEAVELGEQSPVINRLMADMVLTFVHKLLSGTLTWMGAYIDLDAGSLSTVDATPEAVSRITGYTIRQLKCGTGMKK